IDGSVTAEIAPNNLESVFGAPAWPRTVAPDGTPGQWYLRLFDGSRPDLDWENPWVREQFRDILRFWLDRGVDGFRVDVAHGLIKEAGLPDYTPPPEAGSMGGGATAHEDSGDRDAAAHGSTTGADQRARRRQPRSGELRAVYEIYRDGRAVLEEYGGGRVHVDEAWVSPLTKLANWVRPD